PQTYSQSLPQTKGEGPATLLARAREVIGFTHAGNRVLHMHAITAEEQNYQSDRTYPPFFFSMSDEQIWFEPSVAVPRQQATTAWPGSGTLPASVTVDDGNQAQMIRGERTIPVSRRQAITRALNAWAVVADWSAADDVRISGTEVYRDYPRTVLVRGA